MTLPSTIREVQERVAAATAITVLTGAGISADSGIPTFRGVDGLWNNYRPEELASPDAFDRNPRLVWEWYNWRRERIASAQPNAAHLALVELERRSNRFWLITQNVDGLHPSAGTRQLSEIHGNIWKVRCTGCGKVEEDRSLPIPILPTCLSCKSLLRPHIVWFGESLDPHDLRHCYSALQNCEVLLIIGTSGQVYPAASFGSVAKEHGALVIELNLDSTPQSDLVDISVQGRAKELVPQILT